MTDFETHPIGTAKRIEELEAKLAKIIAVLHLIVEKRGYADDPWSIVQSALAELKGGANGKD